MNARRPAARAAALALAAAVLAAPAGAQAPRPPVGGATAEDGAGRPAINLYGVPGGIDTPSAFHRPEGDFSVAASSVGGFFRSTITFQALPWLSGSFRYVGIGDLNLFGFDDYYDRSFDLRFRLLEEGRYLPAVTLGLQDFVGTGVLAGEYVVASKQLGPRFAVSAGLGWGRLGSFGGLGAPFGDRSGIDVGEGGEPNVDQWFRGQAAPFASIDWRATDRLRVKLEYSSDDYRLEQRQGIVDRDSPINAALEYQLTPEISVGAYTLHGSEVGAGFSLVLNPRRTTGAGIADDAPPVVLPRPDRRADPDAYGEGWVLLDAALPTLSERVRESLAAQGLVLEGFTLPSAREVVVRVRDPGVGVSAQTVGRTARILSRDLPASVEVLRIVPVVDGIAVSQVAIRRSDLERAELAPGGTEALLDAAVFADAAALARPAPGDIVAAEIYPRFDWSIGPYARPSFFDPDAPVRYEIGVSARAQWQPAPGVVLSGRVTTDLLGNIEDADPASSELEPVRTDAARYAAESDVAIETLTAAYFARPGRDLYARATAGYLERMFGGVSGELLWKPVASRYALGVEVNYARQRDFDQRFGFRDYDVVTGHVSGYAELGRGFHGQVDVGRYLAGDSGATFTLAREFANGWRIGAFATLTSASAEEFGEGSFDKGIEITIPIRALLGTRTGRDFGLTLRPVTRDGGARLRVEDRLYERVRGFHEGDLTRSWGRVLR